MRMTLFPSIVGPVSEEECAFGSCQDDILNVRFLCPMVQGSVKALHLPNFVLTVSVAVNVHVLKINDITG